MLRFIQVGVAGYGATWLPTIAKARERARHVALVDVNPEALDRARAVLGAPELPGFGTLPEALGRVEALGGTVVHPGESWAICKDSEGSPFGLAASAQAGGP